MLAWRLEHSEHIDSYERLAELGESTPLDSIPETDTGIEWSLRAFSILSASRQQGMGIGAIPISECIAYWNEFGIEPADDFLEMIRALDAEWIRQANARQKEAD